MKKKMTLLLLVVALVGMGVGYSILSKQLKIEGSVTTAKSFNVAITGIERFQQKSVNAGAGNGGIYLTSEKNAKELSEPTFTTDTATFNISLGVGNDIIYFVTLKNSGSMLATLSNVQTTVTGNEDITVEVLNDITNKIFDPSATEIVAIRISYPYKEDLQSYDGTTTVSVKFDATQLGSRTLQSFTPYIISDLNYNVSDYYKSKAYRVINSYEEGYDVYVSVDDGEYVKCSSDNHCTVTNGTMISNTTFAVNFDDSYSTGTHSYKLKLVSKTVSTVESNEVSGYFTIIAD